jgi:flavin-dependent dehydrogenase
VYDTKVQEHFKPDMAFRKNKLADLQIQFPYAYHFNASQLAVFLRDLAKGKGVIHIQDDVVDIQQTEDGSISHIVTKENGEVTGDLFIDCTGFKGMLINKVLKEPFISFTESLLCDSAIALQIPRDIEKDGMNPFTSSTALTSGWVWNIPLYGRDGTVMCIPARLPPRKKQKKNSANTWAAPQTTATLTTLK